MYEYRNMNRQTIYGGNLHYGSLNKCTIFDNYTLNGLDKSCLFSNWSDKDAKSSTHVASFSSSPAIQRASIFFMYSSPPGSWCSVPLNFFTTMMHIVPMKDMYPSTYMHKWDIRLATRTSSIYLCCSMHMSYSMSTNSSGSDSSICKYDYLGFRREIRLIVTSCMLEWT